MAGGVRRGGAADVRALVRMYADCSPVTLRRRFVTATPTLSTQAALELLVPDGGFSVIAERREAMAAIITVGPAGAPGTAEVGLLVADAWQRKGLGTALLNAVAREAGREGFDQLHLTVHPDNRGVLPMVSSAGLRAHVATRDGITHVVIPLTVPARVARA
jgi:GNAT superfamily N-acetyltransferase